MLKIIELENCISQSKDFTLGFFLNKYETVVVSTNNFKSHLHLRAAWVKRYRSAFKANKANCVRKIKSYTIVPEAKWRELHQKNKKEAITSHATGDVHSVLMEWCFNEMEGVEGLEAKRRQHIAEASALVDKRTCLTDLNRLSLSGVINVSSPEYTEVMKKYLRQDFHEDIAALKHTYCLGTDKQQAMESVFEALKNEARKDNPNFGVEVGSNATTIENQIRLVFQYLGKTECFATKETTLKNETSFSSSNSSKRVNGRKIDILVKTGSGKKVYAIEFKRNTEKKQKTGKTRSSSRSILSLEGSSYKFILGLDFTGMSGYLYAMLPYKQLYVTALAREVHLPSNRSDLQQDKLLNALFAVYELKEFWLSVEEQKGEEEAPEENDENRKIIIDKTVFFTPRLASKKLQ
ncbi:hypothetical protein EDC96DRAFT_545122 [Choanephora cucurbitarum]|nr:hypothetical protein EDC96DRAFT_545122 [Choanephora cucurbitarum]